MAFWTQQVTTKGGLLPLREKLGHFMYRKTYNIFREKTPLKKNAIEKLSYFLLFDRNSAQTDGYKKFIQICQELAKL